MHLPRCCCHCHRHPWLIWELHFLSLPLQKTSGSRGSRQASSTRVIVLGHPASCIEQPLVLNLSNMMTAFYGLLYHGSQSNKPPLDVYSFYHFCYSREPLLIDRTELNIRTLVQVAHSGDTSREPRRGSWGIERARKKSRNACAVG